MAKTLKIRRGFTFVYKTVLAAIIFIILLYVLPTDFATFDVSNIFTATSVLFGVLAGFFIAATLTNYFRLQSLISSETSSLISLYNRAKALAPKYVDDVKEAIDRYLIRSFDYELSDYVENTWPEFNELFKFSENVKRKDTNLYASFLDFKERCFSTRQEIELTGRKIMGPVHWILLITLSLATIFLLYCMRDATVISSILTVLLSTSAILILFLVEEIDGDTFAEEKLSFKAFQSVFEEIGKMPYYPKVSIDNKRVTLEKGATYRIGKYIDYPNSYNKEIYTITI